MELPGRYPQRRRSSRPVPPQTAHTNLITTESALLGIRLAECSWALLFESRASTTLADLLTPAARCKSIFDNAGIAAAVVERRVRGWRCVRPAKLAEAAAR